MEVIDPVPIELDATEMLQATRVRTLKEKEMAPLIEMCHQLIEPKAVFAFVKVAGIEKDQVRLESGHTLRSVVLADMLERGQTIVPYVVTIGPGVERQASEEGKSSILRAWILEKMADHALGKAVSHVRSRIEKTLGGSVSGFSPGSGTGKLFGIEQQETLFQILEPSEKIGVNLAPSHLMIPRKSVSGVLAVTRQEYVACQYCPRERCENRTRPFSGEYSAVECEHGVD